MNWVRCNSGEAAAQGEFRRREWTEDTARDDGGADHSGRTLSVPRAR